MNQLESYPFWAFHNIALLSLSLESELYGHDLLREKAGPQILRDFKSFTSETKPQDN